LIKNNVGLDHPHIGIASIRKNELEYLTFVTTNIPKVKDCFEESYDDAIKALKQ